MIYEGSLLNKKVYCFGESEWFPITHQIRILEQLEDIFINYEEKYNLSIYQKKYLAFLLSEYWVGFNDKKAIKNKLKNIIDQKVFKNKDLSIEDECILNILNAQKEYTKKNKRISLIECDFEKQKDILKYMRSHPFYILIYFFKYNFLKLKSKLNI